MPKCLKTSGEVSDLEALLYDGSVAGRAMEIIDALCKSPEALSLPEIAHEGGWSESQTKRALKFASRAGLAAPKGRSGWRATGAGRAAVRRLRRGER